MRKIVMRMVSILLLSVILLAVFLSGCQIKPQAGNDQTTQPGNDKTTQVGNDEATQAGNNETTQAGIDQTTQDGIDQTVLTQEQRKTITNAFAESKAGATKLYWFETDGQGAYYLGEFDGCIVFYNLRTWNPGMNDFHEYGEDPFDLRDTPWRPLNFKIAEVEFSPAFENQLCAYKDGEVLHLSKAYTKGWITQEGVAHVKAAYDAFIRYLVGLGENGYLAHEKKFKLMELELWDTPKDSNQYTFIQNATTSPEYQLFMKTLKEQEK